MRQTGGDLRARAAEHARAVPDGVRLWLGGWSRSWPARLAAAAFAALAFACTGGDDARRGPATEVGSERPVRYERRFWFISSPAGEATVTAVFDFEVVDDGAGSQRATWAWLGRGDAWQPLVDTVWPMSPIREPWRIMPHGSLRLILADNGEVEALVHGTGPDEVRLLPGPPVETWVAPNAEIVYSAAELRVAGLSYRGALLDTRVGFRPGRPALPADSERGQQVFLTDGFDAVLTLLADGTQPVSLWLRREDGTGMVEAARLESVVPEEASPDGIGDEWVVRSDTDGEVRAELRALAVHQAGRRRGLADPARHFPVAGLLFVGDTPRDVVGFVREGSQ